jgi:hypothetical protein
MQSSETLRNSLGLNYKSAALSGGAAAGANSKEYVHKPNRLFTFRQAETFPVSSLWLLSGLLTSRALAMRK